MHASSSALLTRARKLPYQSAAMIKALVLQRSC